MPHATKDDVVNARLKLRYLARQSSQRNERSNNDMLAKAFAAGLSVGSKQHHSNGTVELAKLLLNWWLRG
jgi:hypothetical protein